MVDSAPLGADEVHDCTKEQHHRNGPHPTGSRSARLPHGWLPPAQRRRDDEEIDGSKTNGQCDALLDIADGVSDGVVVQTRRCPDREHDGEVPEHDQDTGQEGGLHPHRVLLGWLAHG